jgi:hypothetical protein
MVMKNIHLLPTDKPSRLFKVSGELKLTRNFDFYNGSEYQNIYITNDEKIKEENWCLAMERFSETRQNWEDIFVYKSVGEDHWDNKKIILTTDQDLIKDGVQAIDDEFLEWFVKNPSCEFVEVIPLRKSSGHYDDKEVWHWDFLAYKIIIPKEEIWKDIPNYESLYQVSNFGNVKSLERYVKGKVENRLQKENILSKRLVGGKGNQYYSVTLCNNKDRKQIKVSVLVAMAFLNHIPNGYVGFTVDHIDNNPLNNNVNNLQVITKRKNSSKDRKGISKYTGVTFNKKSNKWRSQIWIDGKNKTLGSFDDELEAHRAYQKELQQHLKS